MRRPIHVESHLIERIGWLRAAVLGANDGILSTGSVIVGVAAASAGRSEILVAGLAALVAGAMSMAAGEYVSVSSQSDTEHADLERERNELGAAPEAELDELAQIYVGRGVAPDLARQVASQMMDHDALGSHARDELGISDISTARPLQAAFASALTFSAGGVLPLIAALLSPPQLAQWIVSIASLIALALLGVIAARAGGAAVWKPTIRITFWGAAAMALTATVGTLVGAAL